MKKSYNSQGHAVNERPLDDPRAIIDRSDELGAVETAKRLAGNVHERGIRYAGGRSLPLYWLVGFIALMIAGLAISAVAESIPVLGTLLVLVYLVATLVGWFGSAVVIYWDCKAGERYLPQSWRLGKLIALLAVFFGPAALLMQLVYRGRKL